MEPQSALRATDWSHEKSNRINRMNETRFGLHWIALERSESVRRSQYFVCRKLYVGRLCIRFHHHREIIIYIWPAHPFDSEISVRFICAIHFGDCCRYLRFLFARLHFLFRIHEYRRSKCEQIKRRLPSNCHRQRMQRFYEAPGTPVNKPNRLNQSQNTKGQKVPN